MEHPSIDPPLPMSLVRLSIDSLWHIDFLLAHEHIILKAVVAAQTSIKLECEMNRYIKEKGEAEIPVPGFGASDCKLSCKSHLLFFLDIVEGNVLVQKIGEFYKGKGLRPSTFF